MPNKDGNVEDASEAAPGDKHQTALFTQPWWHGLSNSGVSPTSGPQNCTSGSSSGEPANGSASVGTFQAIVNGSQDAGIRANKEIQIALATQSEAEVDSIPGHQSFRGAPSSMSQHLHDHLQSNSVVLASYPFPDSTYGGAMAYAQQVNPQLYGLHQSRMPLPLPMEEEPVYVNAKQYHGILRRRQSRAKAELEKKVIKDRKPYLHESRHRHALRRARGAGGRFLNTKKLDGNNSSETDQQSGTNLQTPSSGSTQSEGLSVNYSANTSSWNQLGPRGLMVSDMHEAQTHSKGSNNVHDLASPYHSLSGANEEKDYYGHGGMKVNGAVSVK